MPEHHRHPIAEYRVTAVDQLRTELAEARTIARAAEEQRRETAVAARAAELAAQQANARVDAYLNALDMLTRMPTADTTALAAVDALSADAFQTQHAPAPEEGSTPIDASAPNPTSPLEGEN